MAEVNEEFIAEYSRIVGNAHIAINDSIGSDTTPGSALYYLNQLSNLAISKLPYFGVIQPSATPGFRVTVDSSDSNFLRVTSGQVAYNGNIISVPSQRVSISKSFAGSYSSSYVYGMKIGFPIEEAQNTTSQIYSSVLSADALEGDTEIFIENIETFAALGLPLTAYIGGNTYIVFSEINSNRTALKIDPAINNGTLSNGSTVGDVIFDTGTRINFIYEPKVKALFGLPVSTGSNDPSAFLYYPKMPDSWLPIADVLVVNSTPRDVATFGSTDAILRTAVDYPSANSTTPIFSTDDARVIQNTINVAKAELNNNKNRASVSDAIQALQNYTIALQEDTSVAFREFWGTRPYKVNTYFGKGTSFEGLERFEFSDNFAKAYYDLNGQDVQRTFAIFRGDLYAYPSAIAGSAPSALDLNSYRAKGTSSTLTRGTYTYGVSAVTTLTGDPNRGETPTKYDSVVSFDSSSNNFINELQWSSVPNALFYHIYKRSNLIGEQIEYRLTEPNQITGSGTAVAGISGTGSTSLATTFAAFKVSTTNNYQLGGIKIRLRATNSALTNTSATVTTLLYSNDGGTGKPNSLVSTFDTVEFNNIIRDSQGDLTTSYQDFILKCGDFKTTTTNYWVVMKLSANPSVGNIQIQIANSGTNTYATTNAGSPVPANWTLANNVSLHHQTLGFLDYGRTTVTTSKKGVYLTGKVTFEPRRLRIYIPEISEFPSPTGSVFTRGDIPVYGLTTTDTKEIKNEMIVTVVARLGTNDSVTLTATIPQGTLRGTAIPLGTENQIFDRVENVSVSPGTNVVTQQGGAIYWSIYDMFTVETTP
jgi:hypothetical protein